MGTYEVIEHVVGDMGENMGKAKIVFGIGDSTAVFWGRDQILFYLRYPLPPVVLYNVQTQRRLIGFTLSSQYDIPDQGRFSPVPFPFLNHFLTPKGFLERGV